MLRTIEEPDAARLFQLRSDPVVMKYLDRPMAQSIDDARELIRRIRADQEANQGITWAICLKEDPALLGTIGYWRIQHEHHRAEIGYLLDPALHGKGMMQEAFQPVIAYGFSVMKLHSIEANVNPSNAASIKILERNGFVREAYFRQNYFYNGQFLDTLIYSLLTPSA
ncbi:MAG TPA: GNAT family protein [Chitinophagaceae bacterium]|nr:GNAT family protein [Chitinophagaceae bacterium]